MKAFVEARQSQRRRIVPLWLTIGSDGEVRLQSSTEADEGGRRPNVNGKSFRTFGEATPNWIQAVFILHIGTTLRYLHRERRDRDGE